MDDEGGDGAGRPEKRTRKHVRPVLTATLDRTCSPTDKTLATQTARQAATLADDFAKIRVKQFDLEFTVDPLFKKTSADFDEGGAGGILMNHLGCDGSMKVVFDAGDAKLDCDEEDEEEEGDAEGAAKTPSTDNLEVDLAKLRGESLAWQREGVRLELLTRPCEQTARCLPNGLDALSTMSLCPSLSFFRFSDAQLDLGLLNLGFDDDNNGAEPLPASASHRQPDARHLASGDDDEDMGGFDDPYLNQDFGGGGDDGDGAEVDFFADQFSGEAAAFGLAGAPAPIASGSGSGGGGGTGFGAVEPFDPRRMADERDLVMSMDGEGDGMFAYFDAKLGKNWAGPEHWKMRRGVAAAKKGGRNSSMHERANLDI